MIIFLIRIFLPNYFLETPLFETIDLQWMRTPTWSSSWNLFLLQSGTRRYCLFPLQLPALMLLKHGLERVLHVAYIIVIKTMAYRIGLSQNTLNGTWWWPMLACSQCGFSPMRHRLCRGPNGCKFVTRSLYDASKASNARIEWDVAQTWVKHDVRETTISFSPRVLVTTIFDSRHI